ncbi:unnamed protein product [Brassicogethes aeneus]|uniref:Uncharacterized protein n=1 Tax=Brassicogethes aeneus TaxID=1431903 RepID=A0A9P0APD6_BRAAE|nr:unnamed protein product [Brassicogethes aeneus]
MFDRGGPGELIVLMENMMIWKKGIILVLQLYLIKMSKAILSGNDETPQEDITRIPGFGCYWQGGSYPGVTCDCRDREMEFVINKNIPSFDAASIEIKNCNKITFKGNSISHMRNLRNLTLNNIAQIDLEEDSLNWVAYRSVFSEQMDQIIPNLKIYVLDSVISNIGIQSFKGNIGELYFDRVTILSTSQYAFANLQQTQSVVFKNCVFYSIMQQAFKKFTTENLQLRNVTAREIPSRMFSDITVNQLFTIQSCNFGSVRSSAFIIQNPLYMDVTNTNIFELDGEGFKVQGVDRVTFANNNFHTVQDGAFRGITKKTDSNMFITLNTNTFTIITRDSLTFPESKVEIIDLCLNHTCDCLNIDHQIKNTEHFSNIKCLYNNQYITVSDFKSKLCSLSTSSTTLIIVLSVVGTLLIIIIAALSIFLRRYLRRGKYGNQKQIKNGQLSLIVPDGRTYRETELHVIVEKTELLTTDL